MNAWVSRRPGCVRRSVHFHYRRGERQAPAVGPSEGTYRAPRAGHRMGCRTRTVAASRGRIGVRDHACYSVRVPRRERLDTVRSYSSAEERSVHTGEVTGSNPVRTTTQVTEPLPVSPGGVRRFRGLAFARRLRQVRTRCPPVPVRAPGRTPRRAGPHSPRADRRGRRTARPARRSRGRSRCPSGPDRRSPLR